MSVWVYPVHDHALIAEMTEGGSEPRIEIHAGSREPGTKCPECDLAARRFVYLFQLMGAGCVDAVQVP